MISIKSESLTVDFPSFHRGDRIVDIVDGGGLSRQSRLISRFGGLEVLEFQLGGFCLKMRELPICSGQLP